MIKPDGVARGLVGEIISRIERKGLKITALKMLHINREKAESHYAEHKNKEFYNMLVDYITSGPCVAMVVEGEDAINVVRAMVGATDPKKALPGTIRGDLAMFISRNIVHASDSKESAKREISLFFTEDEIFRYERSDDRFLYLS